MKRKGTYLTAAALLVVILGIGTWSFVKGVSGQLWATSIRTITESTHQGAMALRLQFETDFNMLEVIRDSLAETDMTDLENALNLVNIAERDVMVYREDGSSLRPEVKLDQMVQGYLHATEQDQGLLDAHISSVTGENVFNIFVKANLEDGAEVYLVKEYHTQEVARQFTLTFYDNTGFSCLINRQGDIMVWPSYAEGIKIVDSLFDVISPQENENRRLEDFRQSIFHMETGWNRFSSDWKNLVFCYEPLRSDSHWLLVSVIPERMITMETLQILRRTMLFSGTAVVIILIMAAIFYGMKLHETEIHTRRLQEALSQADTANRAKGRFLMNMSHDIRTPLNAIIGMTSIAQENTSDQGRVNDCLKKIRTAGTHLLSLVNDVLDMSQIDQGAMILKEETFRFTHLMEDVAELMDRSARENGLTLTLAPVHLDNDVVTGDPSRIRQILFNIIDNAVKYTPPGGSVLLELRQQGKERQQEHVPRQEWQQEHGPKQERQQECGTKQELAREGTGIYCFRCIDTGIGIEREFLDRLFLPFERARDTTSSRIAGTGVGLAITKSLLDLMGGTIQVESAPGKGSAFTVTLPLGIGETQPEPETVPEEVSGPEETTEDGRNYQDKRVLLVEDNELNMEIAEELVSLTGVQVEKAYDGQEAVDLVSNSPPGYYDLIFMDIQMPVMDGYEATRQIRSLDREDARKLPIFAVSANALAEDVQNSLKAGMNGHIAKPVDLGEIEKVMGMVW